ADQAEQAVEAQAHVDRVGAVPQLHGRREAHHDGTPKRRSKQRRVASSAPGAMRTTAPPGRATSRGAAAPWRPTGSQRASRGASGFESGGALETLAAKRRFQA